MTPFRSALPSSHAVAATAPRRRRRRTASHVPGHRAFLVSTIRG